MREDYGLNIWGDGNFEIENDDVIVSYGERPSLLSITKSIRDKGYKGPPSALSTSD